MSNDYNLPGGAPKPKCNSDDNKLFSKIEPTFIISPAFYYQTACSVEPKSSCGQVWTIACENFKQPGDGHEFFKRPATCGRVTCSCSTCSDRELKRQVGETIRRTKALIVQARRQGYQLPENISDSKYYTHATLSPPKTEYSKYFSKKGYKAERQKAERYAQKLGYVGAYICLHLVRGSPREIQDWQAGKIQLEFSPHWHIWGCRPTMGEKTTNDFYASTGWVFRAFYDTRKRYRNVYKTLLYEFGHASMPVDGDTGKHGQLTSPFGILHPYYLRCEKTITKEPLLCRNCGSRMLDEEGRPQSKYKELRKYSLPEPRASRIEAKYALSRGQINPYPNTVVTRNQATI